MMSLIKNDKYLRFVMENFSEITAMLDILEYAEKKLPSIINQAIEATFRELEGDYFDEQGLKVKYESKSQEIWWGDPQIYDLDKYVGPFFGLEKATTLRSISGNDPDIAPILYLYVNTGDSKERDKAYIDQWIAKLDTHRSKLRKTGLLLWYDDSRFDYVNDTLIYYPLNKEINMETIKDIDNFERGLREAVVMFTSSILPVLRMP
jgi:hypothetical protein